MPYWPEPKIVIQLVGKGTFGIQLLQDPEFQLNGVAPRGLTNYRWPHMQYFLTSEAFEDGYFEKCSFVDDKVVYQIARMRLGPEKTTKEPAGETSPTTSSRKTARFRFGGKIRFGCLCTNMERSVAARQHSVQQGEDGKTLICQVSGGSACRAQNPGQYHLRMQLYIDGQRTALKWNPTVNARGSTGVNNDGARANREGLAEDSLPSSKLADISAEHEVELAAGRECVLVLAFALNSGDHPTTIKGAPSSQEVKEILGVSNAQDNRTSKIWWPGGEEEHDNVNVYDIHAIARCVEYICSVTAVPIELRNHEAPTTSREQSTYEEREPRSDAEDDRSPELSHGDSVEKPALLSVDPVLVSPNVERPKSDLESLKILTNSITNQDGGTGQGISPKQSSAHRSEDGQISPSHVRLPAMTNSTSSLNDAVSGGDELGDVLGSECVSPAEPQAITLIRNIMFGQSVHHESTLLVAYLSPARSDFED